MILDQHRLTLEQNAVYGENDIHTPGDKPQKIMDRNEIFHSTGKYGLSEKESWEVNHHMYWECNR